MITMRTILQQLSEKTIAEAMIEMLAAHSEDFREDQQRCNEAVGKLTNELGDISVPSVAEEMEAIHRQLASSLVFSGFLGFQANLNHHMDPVARTFLDVDCEVYLRENTSKQLPEHKSAQDTRTKFYFSLTPEQREVYEGIAMYAHHLESVAPKLSHYFGYIMGDALLPRIVPGYCPDLKMTAQYSNRMTEFLGMPIDDLSGWQ